MGIGAYGACARYNRIFEAGVVILIPLAFNVAKQTKNQRYITRSLFWQGWHPDMRLFRRQQVLFWLQTHWV